MGVLNFGLMNVIYQWAKGMSFVDIKGWSGIQEGAIARSLVRLEELLRKVKRVGEEIHNDMLVEIADDSIKCIKRSVVFAPSLYFRGTKEGGGE